MRPASSISCRAVRVDAEAGALDEAEVDAFIGHRWLVTVRESPELRIGPVFMRWDQSPDLAQHGAGFLLYRLLDAVVDGYFDVVQTLDEYYDAVSDDIFAGRPLDLPQQRHRLDMRGPCTASIDWPFRCVSCAPASWVASTRPSPKSFGRTPVRRTWPASSLPRDP